MFKKGGTGDGTRKLLPTRTRWRTTDIPMAKLWEISDNMGMVLAEHAGC
jgi:hypothetical protein